MLRCLYIEFSPTNVSTVFRGGGSVLLHPQFASSAGTCIACIVYGVSESCHGFAQETHLGDVCVFLTLIISCFSEHCECSGTAVRVRRRGCQNVNNNSLATLAVTHT